jgi:hypothetical protein
MSRFHRVGLVLAGVVVTVLSTGGVLPASASSMHLVPPPGGPGIPAAHPVAPAVRTVVVGGMPGWQIMLIAIAASLMAAIGAVLADRARTTRSRVSLTGARQAQAVPPR